MKVLARCGRHTLCVVIGEDGTPATHRSELVNGACQAPVAVKEGPNASARILSPPVAPEKKWLK